MDTTLDLARSYLEAGLSIVPIKPDGSKGPAVATWKQYQERRATAAEVAEWYAVAGRGVAILGGAVSGNLEIVDFDDAAMYYQWRDMLVAMSSPHEAWRGMRFPVVSTPTGGFHVYARLGDAPRTNHKLARTAEGVTTIETRGTGGYVLAPGCPPRCHPCGATYDLIKGDLAAIPVIDDETHHLFHTVAKTLDQMPVQGEQVSAPRPRVSDGTRPGDLYNGKAEWDGLLRRHGWYKVRARGDVGYWRRPGKDSGLSATTNHADSGYFFCFSSSTRVFEAERAYSLFSAYALLDHGGDFHAAALALYAQGYATPPASVTPPQRTPGGLDAALRDRLAYL